MCHGLWVSHAATILQGREPRAARVLLPGDVWMRTAVSAKHSTGCRWDSGLNPLPPRLLGRVVMRGEGGPPAAEMLRGLGKHGRNETE